MSYEFPEHGPSATTARLRAAVGSAERREDECRTALMAAERARSETPDAAADERLVALRRRAAKAARETVRLRGALADSEPGAPPWQSVVAAMRRAGIPPADGPAGGFRSMPAERNAVEVWHVAADGERDPAAARAAGATRIRAALEAAGFEVADVAGHPYPGIVARARPREPDEEEAAALGALLDDLARWEERAAGGNARREQFAPPAGREPPAAEVPTRAPARNGRKADSRG